MPDNLTNFNLSRYFAITSAIVISLVAIGVAFVFSRLTRQQMIEASQEDALSLTASIEQEVGPALVTLLTDPASADSVQTELRLALDRYQEFWNVAVVTLYNPEGDVVFSNADASIIFTQSDIPGLEQALAGGYWSEFENRFDHQHPTNDHPFPDYVVYVVETFLPVYATDSQQIIGALEVYRDVGSDFERATRLQVLVILVVILSMGGLFAALGLIVRRGDRLLTETNLRFASVLSTTGDAIICADGSGRITLWNDAATRIFGYSAKEMMGQSYTKLVSPLARERLNLPPIGNGPPRIPRAPVATTAIRRDGAIFPVDISFATYYLNAPAGSGYEFSAVVRDVTRRMEAERDIQQRIEELTILSSVAATVNQSTELDDILTAALTEIETALGLPYSQVWFWDRQTNKLRPYVHRGLPDDFAHEATAFVLDEGLPDMVAETNQSLLVQDTETDHPFIGLSGERLNLNSALGIPLRTQERLVGVMNFFTHESSRFAPGTISCLTTVGLLVGTAVERARLYESAKRQTEELMILNQIANSVNQSLDLEQTLDHALATTISALQGHIGGIYLRNETNGKLELVAAQGAQGRLSDIDHRWPIGHELAQKIVETNQPLRVADASINPHLNLPEIAEWRNKQGLYAFLGVPLRVQGETVGVIAAVSQGNTTFSAQDEQMLVGIAQHVSLAIENARLYETLQMHATILEEEVTKRTEALMIALEKSLESDRLKSEFVSNVNHELRTPLTSIKLCLGLMANANEAQQAYYMATLGRETQRLGRLIDDLLHLSRMDLGRIQPDLQVVDVNELLNTLVEDRRALITSRGLVLAIDLAQTLPPTLADPNLLSQVATNLLTNAMNYTPEGGQIRLTTAEQEHNGRPYVTFSVADTGPGINPEDLPHLFERFYRGAVGKSTKAPGTGLGLAISKEILALHEGWIKVDSELEKGSAFTVWLPLAKDPVAS